MSYSRTESREGGQKHVVRTTKNFYIYMDVERISLSIYTGTLYAKLGIYICSDSLLCYSQKFLQITYCRQYFSVFALLAAIAANAILPSFELLSLINPLLTLFSPPQDVT